MIKFNLDLVKQGYKVVTRDGRDGRIICTDRKGGEYPVICLLSSGKSESELCHAFTLKGTFLPDGREHPCDLFLKAKTTKRYFAMYRNRSTGELTPMETPTKTREEAERRLQPGNYNTLFEPLYVQEVDFVEQETA